VLREAGLEVGPGRLVDAMAGLDQVELASRDDVYWTLRTTLVTSHEELEAFDRAFAAWFLRAPARAPSRPPAPPKLSAPSRQRTLVERASAGENKAGADEPKPGSSAEELLRQKDFAAMSEDEFARARVLISAIAATRPRRRSRRLRPHARGRMLDLRRLLRGSMSTGGDPIERAFRRRIETPRKLVVLCDVSASMEAYARALLLFLHAVVGSGRGVEAFAFGTRLTRLTAELRTRDPEQALWKATGRVVDWSSGTRIGASLKAFNDIWGRRALTRGAVVLIVSDGWERQDVDLVGREMARLARAAYSLVWVNPLKGHPDYQPLAGGMRAALPHIDRFMPGHNLASLEELADVLGRSKGRHAA
jgi:uncharacterized protein with von Willebrand factor type A (vWA) domain